MCGWDIVFLFLFSLKLSVTHGCFLFQALLRAIALAFAADKPATAGIRADFWRCALCIAGVAHGATGDSLPKPLACPFQRKHAGHSRTAPADCQSILPSAHGLCLFIRTGVCAAQVGEKLPCHH